MVGREVDGLLWRMLALLGRSWEKMLAVLGCSWSLCGRSWAQKCEEHGYIENLPISGAGARSVASGAVWGRSWILSWRSRAALGPYVGGLGPLLGPIFAILGPLLAVLGRSWDLCWRSWAVW